MFFIGSGSDTLSLGCFSGDQPALLEKLSHQTGYKLLSYLIAPVLIAQAADLKFLRGILRDRGYDVEVDQPET